MPRYVKDTTGYPRLDRTNHEVKSPKDRNYNCAAWAIRIKTAQWWPELDHYWPAGAPMVESVDAFIAAYKTERFEVCADGNLEPGFEKIVIYARFGAPVHVARQLRDKRWTSKMGWKGQDIYHNTEFDVGGRDYGEPHTYMRRQIIVSRQGRPQSRAAARRRLQRGTP